MLYQYCYWTEKELKLFRTHLLNVMSLYTETGVLYLLQLIVILYVECLINLYAIKTGMKTDLYKTYKELRKMYNIKFHSKLLTKLNMSRNRIVHAADLDGINEFVEHLVSIGEADYKSLMHYVLGDVYDERIINALWERFKKYKAVDFEVYANNYKEIIQERLVS